MGFFGFLRRVGRTFRTAVALIYQHIDPDDLDHAIDLVRGAAIRFVDNAERREWVVRRLMERGFPESLARLLVELAVRTLKDELQSR